MATKQPLNTLGVELSKIKNSTITRNSRRSSKWLSNKIKKIDKRFVKSRPFPGKFYTFQYVAKNKATMPYYDKNPLILCLDYTGDHFLGLNFHYLPPVLRLQLLKKIMPFATGDHDNAKINANYSQLSHIKLIRPTIKKYLKSYTRSKMILIPKDEWSMMIALPYAKFSGANNNSVYKNSRRSI